MSALIKWLTTVRNLVFLLILDLALMLGLMPMLGKKMEALGGPSPPIDLMIPTYQPSQAIDAIATSTEEGLAFYRKITMSADVIYPIVFTFAFSALLLFLGKRIFKNANWVKYLPLIPILMFVADMCENWTIINLIDQSRDWNYDTAVWASRFSLVKWISAFTILGLLIAGLARIGIGALLKKKT